MAKAKESIRVQGVYAALATPRRTGSIEADAAALLEYLDTITAAGVDGLVLFGATGEFVHFDVAERQRVLTLAQRRSRVPLLVNVSHSSLEGVNDLASHAIDTGAAGLMLMPPYFYTYNDSQIEAFYRRFSETLGDKIPVYLYNLPFYTSPISAALAATLLQSGNFAGIKDSSGDWTLFEALHTVRQTTAFQLIVGHEAIYVRAALRGIDGIISGIAAGLPELPVAIHRAIQASQSDRARDLGSYLDEILVWLGKFPGTVGIKQIAVARGWKQNHLATPPDAQGHADLAAFREWLTGWLPGVLARCAN